MFIVIIYLFLYAHKKPLLKGTKYYQNQYNVSYKPIFNLLENILHHIFSTINYRLHEKIDIICLPLVSIN